MAKSKFPEQRHNGNIHFIIILFSTVEYLSFTKLLPFFMRILMLSTTKLNTAVFVNGSYKSATEHCEDFVPKSEL